MPQMVHPRMCGAAHHHDPVRKLILVGYLHICGGVLHRIFTTPLHGVATPGHKPTSAKMRGVVCVYQALGGGGCCEGCGGVARGRALGVGGRWWWCGGSCGGGGGALGGVECGGAECGGAEDVCAVADSGGDLGLPEGDEGGDRECGEADEGGGEAGGGGGEVGGVGDRVGGSFLVVWEGWGWGWGGGGADAAVDVVDELSVPEVEQVAIGGELVEFGLELFGAA